MNQRDIRAVIKNQKQQHLYERAEAFIAPFKSRAPFYDKHAAFPFKNMDELKQAGMTTLTVKQEYGGDGVSLYEFLLVQETLARGDAATALSLGWHNGIFMQLSETGKWPEEVLERISKEAAEKHVLMNTAASEKATGSPARGGLPETEAQRGSDGGWLINGWKTFTSLAPALDYFIITATIKPENEVGEFLIPADTKGVRIEETWDTLSMRATRSDDLHLENVRLGPESLVSRKEPGHGGKTPQGWLLHIPACYSGVAQAARDEAVAFARDYQPNSLDHPVSEVPEVRRKVAEMDLELMASRHFMYRVAELWDENPDERHTMAEELAAVKTVCTNAALKVVDLSMRIAGGHSLHRSEAFERYYRDVRAGLHNPPSDDLTMMALAKRAFDSEN